MTGRLLLSEPLPAAETEPWTTAAERAEAARFGSERRRREYLTWRTLVRRELGRGAQIAYDGVGAPVVTEPGGFFIGVSHCRERVAVCISTERCAVDIESVGRDFAAASERCMTAGERALSDDGRLGALLWCAKETLYKYARRRGLDLCRDLRLLEADPVRGRLVGRVGDGAPLPMRIDRVEEALVVSLFGNPEAPLSVERLLF